MARYHVTYFYHAQGMDGPDVKDYGTVDADTPGDACTQVAVREYPEDIMYGPNESYSTRDFFRGCLSAILI